MCVVLIDYFICVFNSFCKIIKYILKAVVIMKKYISLKIAFYNCEKHTFSNKITASYFLTRMLFPIVKR